MLAIMMHTKSRNTFIVARKALTSTFLHSLGHLRTVSSFAQMVRLMANSGNPIPIEEFEYKVRRIINDYIVPPKNDYKLNNALWWMDRFRKELVDRVRITDVHDLFKVYEVENIIQCATMSALASKERKESRWGLWHYRTDYPDKNDSDWLKHIVITHGEAPEDIKVSYRDIVKLGTEEK